MSEAGMHKSTLYKMEINGREKAKFNLPSSLVKFRQTHLYYVSRAQENVSIPTAFYDTFAYEIQSKINTAYMACTAAKSRISSVLNTTVSCRAWTLVSLSKFNWTQLTCNGVIISSTRFVFSSRTPFSMAISSSQSGSSPVR